MFNYEQKQKLEDLVLEEVGKYVEEERERWHKASLEIIQHFTGIVKLLKAEHKKELEQIALFNLRLPPSKEKPVLELPKKKGGQEPIEIEMYGELTPVEED